MAKKLTTVQKALHDKIRQGGETGVEVVSSDTSNLEALIGAGLVETAEVEGKKLARVKPEAKLNGAAAVETSAIEIESDVEMAPAQRGGRKEEQYPFSKLEVGQSFVVPATEAYPKPWESFASTVSSATRRFSEKSTQMRKNRKGVEVPMLVPTRKFTLRKVTAGDVYKNGKAEKVTGARVFRIQ